MELCETKRRKSTMVIPANVIVGSERRSRSACDRNHAIITFVTYTRYGNAQSHIPTFTSCDISAFPPYCDSDMRPEINDVWPFPDLKAINCVQQIVNVPRYGRNSEFDCF